MTWIPTVSKIVDFGLNWLDGMLIPETTDPVLGEDDPGGGSVLITAMGSASGKAFAYIANNLQKIKNISIFEDTTINVTDVATLQAALTVVGLIDYIHKDAILSIELAAGSYAWPSAGAEARPAVYGYNISGEGTLKFLCNGVTISGDCESARPLVQFEKCSCDIILSGSSFVLKNTKAAGIAAVKFIRCKYIEAGELDIQNDTGDTLDIGVSVSAVDWLDLNALMDTNAPAHTGIDWALVIANNSTVYSKGGDLVLGSIQTRLFSITKNSKFISGELDSVLPTGLLMAGILDRQVVLMDDTSNIEAIEISGSGSGTRSSPYTITIAWESGADTARLIQNIIDILPRPLNVWVKLKLPAGTITGSVFIEDIDGRGGLLIEGDNVLLAPGITQNTVFDHNTDALVIDRVRVAVILGSLKLDNNTGPGALEVTDSRQVNVTFCYLIAAAGSGGSPSFGNALLASGTGTNVRFYGNKIGACNQAGVRAVEGAKVDAILNYEIDNGANRPQQYGQDAYEGAYISRSVNATEFITGAGGIDAEDRGGQVFNS